MSGVDYQQSGVDIDAGNEAVRRIKALARRTYTSGVLSGVGSFGGLFALDPAASDPVLVASADGVGTKLKVAFMTGIHNTIGVDLVNHCVNDILVQGARPLFFLDYLATGRLAPDVAEQIVSGVAQACIENGCALLGGETAEMPGFYPAGEYDMAGFVVGVVEKSEILDGKKTKAGDVVIGVASSGLHSNGYSLVRKALLEKGKLELASVPEGLNEPLVDALMRPTKIYVKAVRAAIATSAVHAISHITGGGLPGNVPRVLPDGLGVELRYDAWEKPAIFDLVQRVGGTTRTEMLRTFNMGLGLVMAVEASAARGVIEALKEAGEKAWEIGHVVEMPGAVDEARVRIS